MKARWKNMTTQDRIINALIIILSVAVIALAASMIVSGLVALFGESKSFMIASLVVLFLGFAISIAVLLRVQKKYNGGAFS